MSIQEVDKNKETPEDDSVRKLTTGEIALARTVFGNRIDYEKVRIHHGSYLPFGMQGEYVAMTPNGELYFRHWHRPDFSKTSADTQHLFIHEMTHVWQRERGMNVIGRGMFSWLASYHYQLDGRLLSEYPMEQQAQIVADYFTLESQGYDIWLRLKGGRYPDITLDGDVTESVIRPEYKNAMRGFPW